MYACDGSIASMFDESASMTVFYLRSSPASASWVFAPVSFLPLLRSRHLDLVFGWNYHASVKSSKLVPGNELYLTELMLGRHQVSADVA